MKFTSEDLLKAMGLKIGDTFKVGKMVYKIVIDDNQTIVRRLSNDGEYVLYGIGDFLNYDYEIIQPKPTLTEDEKTFAKLAHNQGYRYLSKNKHEKTSSITKEKPIRCNDGTWVCEDGEFYFYLNMFPTLFQFIKWEDEPYSIEELLKEDNV